MSNFADPLDRASDLEEKERQNGINKILSQAGKARLPFIGRCYNCDEELDSGLFCDNDCRDDYEWREERRKHHI